MDWRSECTGTDDTRAAEVHEFACYRIHRKGRMVRRAEAKRIFEEVGEHVFGCRQCMRDYVEGIRMSGIMDPDSILRDDIRAVDEALRAGDIEPDDAEEVLALLLEYHERLTGSADLREILDPLGFDEAEIDTRLDDGEED